MSDMMPAIFIGHGSPMNGVEDNEFSNMWKSLRNKIPVPRAIVSISAHWQTEGTHVTSNENPKTIHDFYGFPPELYELSYNTPGAPILANNIKSLISNTKIVLDNSWGLDHGTWIVLRRIYPDATIPTIQLSLDYTKPPRYHYELAKRLKQLREQEILILGSGNIVHNLPMMIPNLNSQFDWAIEYDVLIRDLIREKNFEDIINYNKYGKIARLSIPTNEHYLPLLYILALQDASDTVSFTCEKVIYGSISMRCVILQ
jgi:4,5-DOPA dioxygenase extradiol